MRISKNEKGVALLIVLILTAVALMISAGLLYLVLQSTRISGSMNRYKTVYEAAAGGAEIACELVNAGVNPNIPGITLNIPNNPRLFDPAVGKLNVPATSWPAGYDRSIDINTADPDAWFTLGGLQNNQYTVYIKIIDMVGNMSGVVRGTGTAMHTGGVVQNAGSGITSANTVRLFTVEVLAQNTSNVLERARLSVLYQY
jgi:hypothetical protein